MSALTWAYGGDHSQTAEVLGRAAAWAATNVIVALWLSRRYSGRPFGWNAEPQLATGLVPFAPLAIWLSYGEPWLADLVPAWTVLAWWAACLPVPLWAELRRGRYPRWAPLPRWQAAATLASVPVLIALFLPQAGGAAMSLAMVVPMLVAVGAPWLRVPAVPSFPVAEHAQPWWPRTPGWYPDGVLGLRPHRFWDGSRWLADPGLDRRVRRLVAQVWTGVLIAVTPLCALVAALANRMLLESRGPDVVSSFRCDWGPL
ncbi:MAG: hypothetical protein WCF04_05320 [Candidatus Nanopelagicales bacterium]